MKQRIVLAAATVLTTAVVAAPVVARAGDVEIIGMPTRPAATGITELVCYNPQTINKTIDGNKVHLTWAATGTNAADVDKGVTVSPFGQNGCPQSARTPSKVGKMSKNAMKK